MAAVLERRPPWAPFFCALSTKAAAEATPVASRSYGRKTLLRRGFAHPLVARDEGSATPGVPILFLYS
jgi:hypothetical protein